MRFHISHNIKNCYYDVCVKSTIAYEVYFKVEEKHVGDIQTRKEAIIIWFGKHKLTKLIYHLLQNFALYI